MHRTVAWPPVDENVAVTVPCVVLVLELTGSVEVGEELVTGMVVVVAAVVVVASAGFEVVSARPVETRGA